MLFLYRFLVNIAIADMVWTEIKNILDNPKDNNIVKEVKKLT